MTAAEPAALVPDVADEVQPGVQRVLCDNPGMMTGPGTNTYLVGHDELAVIDPGPDDDAHLDAIARLGGDRIRWILCTHTHPDHSPGAAGLKERTGADVLAFADVDGLVCDRHLADGDAVEVGDVRIEAVHTPGHASNHLCYRLEPSGLLFSGDHVMDGSTVVISPPDGDMAQYLRSLQRLLDLRLPAIAPAHGRLIEDPDERVDDYLRHRLAREAEVLAQVRAAGRRGSGTEALVEVIYTDVVEALHPVARRSVWAHLRKLADEGLVSASDVDDEDATWFAADG